MGNIDRELEKLICYCMDKDVIEAKDVEAVTTEQTTNKIFDMVNAIAEHNQKKALDLYYDVKRAVHAYYVSDLQTVSDFVEYQGYVAKRI